MKNAFSRLAGLALFCTVYTFTTIDALAFKRLTCGRGTPLRWQTNTAVIRASNSFPRGSMSLDALRLSIGRFNAHPSPFRVALQTGDNNVLRNNGQSETWFSTNPNDVRQDPGSGVTWYVVDSTCRIVEADIIYSTTGWAFSNVKNTTFSYMGRLRLFEGTALHELGHFAGVNHENREYNMMGSDFTHLSTNGPFTFGYVGEDLSDGLVATYGTFALQDVGVVHWKYNGPSPGQTEYSSHRRTEMFNSSGSLLPTTAVNGELGFVVRRGQQVQVEFTYENNGRDFKPNVSNRIYFSTNDIISTTDTLLFSNTVNLRRNNVSTFRYRVTIPSGVALGNYWVGALLDGNKMIAERNERNNATYIGVRVQ
jgi:hypothetical protein